MEDAELEQAIQECGQALLEDIEPERLLTLTPA
jgi:hypothetical protein